MKDAGLKLEWLGPEAREQVTPWYAAAGDDFPPDYTRPDSRFFGASVDGKLVACAFLIETNTKTALIEFVQTDHSAPVIMQSRAMVFLLESLCALARTLGNEAVMGLVSDDHSALIALYKRRGAIPTRKKYQVFYKGV